MSYIPTKNCSSLLYTDGFLQGANITSLFPVFYTNEVFYRPSMYRIPSTDILYKKDFQGQTNGSIMTHHSSFADKILFTRILNCHHKKVSILISDLITPAYTSNKPHYSIFCNWRLQTTLFLKSGKPYSTWDVVIPLGILLRKSCQKAKGSIKTFYIKFCLSIPIKHHLQY